MKVKKVKFWFDFGIPVNISSKTNLKSLDQISEELCGQKYDKPIQPPKGDYFLDIRYIAKFGDNYQLLDKDQIIESLKFENSTTVAYPVQLIIME